MKMAPLYREFAKYSEQFEVKLIHTGQHYDDRMSKFFFIDLLLPEPDEYLEVGSGSHGVQTARIMERYEKVLLADRPDLVIVAGDVNSTIACALDAAKLHIPVAHLEAGLRSWDRSMPEELNRLMTDAISDYLLIPSKDARFNLLQEGIPENKIYFVGNIMIDSLIQHRKKAENSNILAKLDLHKADNTRADFVLITMHRPSNVDNEDSLLILLNTFKQLSEKIRLIFPIHPRARKNMKKYNLENDFESITNLMLIDPIGYYDFMKLQMTAKFVVTDSGGIQEETTFFGIPCLTVRPNTERPITIVEGTNELVGLSAEKIMAESAKILQGNFKMGRIPQFWDGRTAERIVQIFINEFEK
ncbi:MAG: UDP-N-acetylglucosamine 2-epimerase [Candidatus Cloacimonas sp. SDB]|nr:MAG: UDP-N-acetylglucosamine 2-epimerase [Candidatus Cloacimonas sp. SDB]